ncbi:MAG: hypothetical protein AB7P14_23615 [Blastocatellales bacterium]
MATTQAKRGVHLNMKLAAGVKHNRLKKVLADAPGIESVIQTFPDETDEELSRMYVLEVDPAEVDAAIAALNHQPEIEYVEPSAPRRLIRKAS